MLCCFACQLTSGLSWKRLDLGFIGGELEGTLNRAQHLKGWKKNPCDVTSCWNHHFPFFLKKQNKKSVCLSSREGGVKTYPGSLGHFCRAPLCLDDSVWEDNYMIWDWRHSETPFPWGVWWGVGVGRWRGWTLQLLFQCNSALSVFLLGTSAGDERALRMNVTQRAIF